MINWIEKGYGLIEEIKAQGHTIKMVNNEWVTSNDEAVQAIIDSYDPLPRAKQEARQRIIKQCQDAAAVMENAYPEIEKRTFTRQEAEARAYVADNSAATPILSAIASARGLTVGELANRVIAHSDLFTAQAAALIALRQAKEDQIDNSTDWREVQNINLEV